MRKTTVVGRQGTLLACIGLLVSGAGNLRADTIWQGATNTTLSWFDSTNWTAGVPNSGVDAAINNLGMAQILSGAGTVRTLSLGGGSGQSGVLQIYGGSLTASGVEQVGVSGEGILQQSGGANNLDPNTGLVIGVAAHSSGLYALSGNSTLSGGNYEYIGEFGAGGFNQSDYSSNTTNTMYMASGNSSSSGTYNLELGSLMVGTLFVGYAGTATFTQTGGHLNVTSTLGIGTSGTGTMRIVNAADTIATLNNDGQLSLGGANNFQFQTAGSITISGNYTQFASHELDIGIGGGAADTQYADLHVTGTASLNGPLYVNLTNGFVPAYGETFTIISAGTRTGTFSSANLATGSWGHFNINYTSNSVILTVVPEPAIILPAALLLFGLRRR